MYTKTTINKVPKRGRKSESRFERTPEWQLMKADIDKGLKPQAALQVQLTDADKEKYKIKNRHTIARLIKKYLNESELDYVVKSFRRDDQDFIVVENHEKKRTIT